MHPFKFRHLQEPNKTPEPIDQLPNMRPRALVLALISTTLQVVDATTFVR